MKPTKLAALAVGLAGAAFLILSVSQPRAAAKRPSNAAAEPVIITVHADKTGAPISPSLYGIFFEEINHAGDGGLYAELVRNRDFEDAPGQDGGIRGWSLHSAGSAARLSLDLSSPLTSANPHALRVDIPVGEKQVSLANEGFWGVPIKSGETYRLSFYARCSPDFEGLLSASLEGQDGKTYAKSGLTGIQGQWKKLSCTLRANGDDPKGRLTISTLAHGTLWLDVVSLFPEKTFKGRRNGLRADLAGRLRDMKPAFVRFPGGCYVEGGDYLKNAFHWKRTIGDVTERPGHLNATWNYRSTDGLGYHEFLQLCEDIHSEPLFVVNCGMAHKEFVPIDQLDPWIQEALDAIEYANGPATSKWGAERAKNGHPKPFNLRYIEIGNENGLFGAQFGGSVPMYAVRYKPFFDAIKAKYPSIRTIADTRVPHPMEFVDDHYYNGPDWFWMNTHLYDKQNRNGPKVYVGEYAVTSNCGTGNLKAALAEAAFMTGLERNGDLVELASYAPLFVNANDRKWNPDAIVFDNAKSYGTPSYWVQKLFAENRPDVNIPVDAPELVTAGGRGGIGLGTWRTQAEYKDIEVIRDGRIVYRSDFTNDASGWKPVRGKWEVADGAYRQTAPQENLRALLNNADLANARDYTLRLKARKTGGAEGFLVMFRTQGERDWYWWNIGGWNNTEHSIEKAVGGGSVPFAPHVRGSIVAGRWYDIRIEAEGERIRCYLDGTLIHDVRDRGRATLAAIAGRVSKTGEIILKVVNGAEQPREVSLDLAGAGKLDSSAQITTLTADSLEAENSLSQPDRIVPKTMRLSGVSAHFKTTVPARSLTVLRLKPVR